MPVSNNNSDSTVAGYDLPFIVDHLIGFIKKMWSEVGLLFICNLLILLILLCYKQGNRRTRKRVAQSHLTLFWQLATCRKTPHPLPGNSKHLAMVHFIGGQWRGGRITTELSIVDTKMPFSVRVVSWLASFGHSGYHVVCQCQASKDCRPQSVLKTSLPCIWHR